MDIPEPDKKETALHRSFPTSLASTAAILKSQEVEGGRGRDLHNQHFANAMLIASQKTMQRRECTCVCIYSMYVCERVRV